MKKAAHTLFLAVIASAMLLPVFASQQSSSASSSEPGAAVPTSTQPTTSVAATSPTTAATASSASSPAASATTTHASSGPTSSTPATQATSVVPTTATDSAGQLVTTEVPVAPTTSSPSPSHTNSSSDSSSGGLSTGSIVGLSVSGGLAAVGIILFFVWKFTRKRFTDFDDNEAIKWPELNAHNNDVHPLPTNATGRAGFGPENDSDINLTRAPSPGGTYANSIAASVHEMYGAGDPYAVPPLPHLNPTQPYRDDPGAYGQPTAYYDPYRGPAPNTFDAISDGHGTESIPMTRMRSPGPQMAYDMQGRGSPAPQAAMGYAGVDERSRTPNPGALSAGRASPSPHPGYGYGPR